MSDSLPDAQPFSSSDVDSGSDDYYEVAFLNVKYTTTQLPLTSAPAAPTGSGVIADSDPNDPMTDFVAIPDSLPS